MPCNLGFKRFHIKILDVSMHLFCVDGIWMSIKLQADLNILVEYYISGCLVTCFDIRNFKCR